MSMSQSILNSIRKLWQDWNVRGSVILSLFLQASLHIFAPVRQRARSKMVLMSVWMAYLLCDWTANVAIGLISKSKGDASKQNTGSDEFMALWGSFLLLHLGGPDAITSFAVEDNQLWLRQFAGLLFQVLSTAYIFYLSFPENRTWIPTAMVFVAGTIKYTERTYALYLASWSRFGRSVLPKPYPGPDYVEAYSIHSSMGLSHVSEHSTGRTNPSLESGNTKGVQKKEVESPRDSKPKVSWKDEVKLLQEGYDLFQSFKVLILGYLLSQEERELSRQYFLAREAKEAFKLIAYEFNFMYDLLHTKVAVVRSRTGYIFRLISISSMLCALLVFFSVDKLFESHEKFNIKLSYALLVGALALEAISVLKLIFSEWTLVSLNFRWSKYIAALILAKQTWSRSISQYEMISYCLKGTPKWLRKLASCLRLEEILEKITISLSLHSEEVCDDLQEFIFKQLKGKSLTAETIRAAKDACLERGGWALQRIKEEHARLKWSIEKYQYVESLLLWHLATEMCYQSSCSDNTNNKDRKICKLISNYMLYLLVMQPTMMAPVSPNWQIPFQDTTADAKRFFSRKKQKTLVQQGAITEAIAVETPVSAVHVKGRKSKSVFFDTIRLAQQLSKLQDGKCNLKEGNCDWELMSEVWMELMSYAAINCTPTVHAQQPSRGGELLTFVWLLMNHLGLGTQFDERAELLV